MGWLTEHAIANPHGSPDTVPVARIGGRLWDDAERIGWSATCFPVSFRDKVLLLTPQHSLDGVVSSDLWAVSNDKVVDELGPKHIDLGAWVRSDTLDLAVAEVDPEMVKPWTLWPARSLTAALDQVGPAEAVTLHVTAMPRPFPGAQTSRTTIGEPIHDGIESLRMAGEFVVPCLAHKGASGSPVFLSDNALFGFAGLVTSAATEGAIVNTIVLSAPAIEDFLAENF